MNITVQRFPADWASISLQVLKDVGQAHGSTKIIDDIPLNGFEDIYLADLYSLTKILGSSAGSLPVCKASSESASMSFRLPDVLRRHVSERESSNIGSFFVSGGRWSFVFGQQWLPECSEGKYKKILLDRQEGRVFLSWEYAGAYGRAEAQVLFQLFGLHHEIYGGFFNEP